MLYTVESATKKKDIQKEGMAPAQVLALLLTAEGASPADGPVTAEWFTPATTPIPQPGDKLDGDVKSTEYGLKFTKARANGYQGGGGGGGRGLSPEDRASIVRQHSQDMALRALELAAQWNVVQAPGDPAALFALIEKTTEWFVKDARKVVA